MTDLKYFAAVVAVAAAVMLVAFVRGRLAARRRKETLTHAPSFKERAHGAVGRRPQPASPTATSPEYGRRGADEWTSPSHILNPLNPFSPIYGGSDTYGGSSYDSGSSGSFSGGSDSGSGGGSE